MSVIVRRKNSIIPSERVISGSGSLENTIIHSRIDKYFAGRIRSTLSLSTDYSWVVGEPVSSETFTMTRIGYAPAAYGVDSVAVDTGGWVAILPDLTDGVLTFSYGTATGTFQLTNNIVTGATVTDDGSGSYTATPPIVGVQPLNVDSIVAQLSDNYIDICRIGDFVYGLTDIGDDIHIFSYIGGELKFLSNKDNISNPRYIDTDGTYLFIGTSGNNVYAFSISPVNGSLTSPSDVITSNGPGWIHYADGYIYRQIGNSTAVIEFNPTTAVLTSIDVNTNSRTGTVVGGNFHSGRVFMAVKYSSGDGIVAHSFNGTTLTRVINLATGNTNVITGAIYDGTYYYISEGTLGISVYTTGPWTQKYSFADGSDFIWMKLYNNLLYTSTPTGLVIFDLYDGVDMTKHKIEEDDNTRLFADSSGIYLACYSAGIKVYTGTISDDEPTFTATMFGSGSEPISLDGTYYDGLDLNNNNAASCTFLYVEILTQEGTSTPNINVSVDGGTTTSAELEGIGDFCIIPLNDLDLSTNLMFKKVSSTSDATLKWMLGRY